MSPRSEVRLGQEAVCREDGRRQRLAGGEGPNTLVPGERTAKLRPRMGPRLGRLRGRQGQSGVGGRKGEWERQTGPL